MTNERTASRSSEPFLRGWYHVIESSRLPKNAVRPVRRMGRDLVAARDGAGDARVYDAHCPHLGAHLGYGGRFVDGSLTCPFHGWQFDASGRCTLAPHARTVPSGAALKPWPVRELNGSVYFYYHEARRQPDFELSPVEGFADAGARAPTLFEYTQRASPEAAVQMLEQVIDLAHFPVIHKGLPRLGMGTPLPELTSVDDEGAFFRSSLRFRSVVFGRESISEQHFTVEGPGVIVARNRGPIDFTVIGNITPVEADEYDHKTRIRILRPHNAVLGAVFERLMLPILRRDLTREGAIFEHLEYRPRPLLSSADGPIPRFRRWISRFRPAERSDAAGSRARAPGSVAGAGPGTTAHSPSPGGAATGGGGAAA